MKLLKKVYHNQAVNVHGRTISREAVRGIILENQRLLMVFSEKNGDYKFPGGGIASGETHAVALTREIREEIGKRVTEIGQPFGKVIEYDSPLEEEFDVFKMTSYYYWCKVDTSSCSQRLDPYEKELGYLPVWIQIDSAIRTNIALVQDSQKFTPRWVRRELEVLELLKTQIPASERGVI